MNLMAKEWPILTMEVMHVPRLRSYAMSLTVALGAWTHGQVSMEANGTSETPTPVVAGRQSIDLVPVRPDEIGLALRHGYIVPGSEQLELGGRVLKRGRDYHLDAEAGVVYLMIQARPGDTLRAIYRHDPEGKIKSGTSDLAAKLGSMRFDLVPGAMGMVLGLGMTERMQDGSVLRSNVYGLNNSFSVAPGWSIAGAYMVGDRQRTEARSGFEVEGAKKETETGKSKFVVQQMKAGLLGGSVTVDYQDISKNFTGFSAVAGNLQGANVDQLRKERGLERQGFSLQDANVGVGKFSQSMRTVKDDTGSLEWRTLGFASGGFSLNWDSRKIDKDFKRFNDLAEGDREQLKKEAGLNRENLAIGFKQSVGAMSYTANKIEDGNGKGIHRRAFTMEAVQTKFTYGDQHIEDGFTAFGGLAEGERGQWAREGGLRREWFGVETALLGAKSPVKFSSSSVRNDNGDFRSTDLSAQLGGFTVTRNEKIVDEKFGALPNLAPAELGAHVQGVAQMYQPTGIQIKNTEAGAFAGGYGIDRTSTRITGQPLKDVDVRAESLSVSGMTSGATVDFLQIVGKSAAFKFRNQRTGNGFNEFGKLMEFERHQLGNVAGLDTSEVEASTALPKGGKATFSQLQVAGPNGGLERTEAGLTSKNLDVKFVTRNVDDEFNDVGQYLHPERQLFAGMKGYKQSEMLARWQILPTLKVYAQWYDAKNSSLERDKVYRETRLAYALDKHTQVDASRIERKDDDPLNTIFAQQHDTWSIRRDFGRFGVVSFAEEKVTFAGTEAKDPDRTKTYVGYETKIDDKTSFKTEQIVTKFEGGTEEKVSANTVSKEITPRMGVSVTDVKINREGEEKDETKRVYGFWYDFGQNIRIKYGVDRQLKGDQGASLKSDLSVTPGQVGDVKIDSANYNVDRVDDSRQNRHVGNVQLGTVKPLQFGPLSNVTFRFAADTERNHFDWRKENRDFNFGAKLGSTAFGFSYKSQVHPTGDRGVDRKFSFNTDPSDKARLNLALEYKTRTLPGDEQIVMRNYAVTWRPWSGVELTHNVQTNPETTKGDAFLGSIVKAAHANKWRLGFSRNPDTKMGLSWEELIDESKKSLSRIGGIDLSLFNKSGSPLSLFYGVEQKDLVGKRQTVHRYHLRFDQKPGPNQLFSVFAGNVSYEHSIAEGWNRNNWTVLFNYQLRF